MSSAALLSSPQQSDDRCWRIALDARPQLHYWDGECLLFHGATGDTHRMPEAVGQLIERLLTAPASVEALSQAIDLHEDDVVRTLEELVRLGVVELLECL